MGATRTGLTCPTDWKCTVTLRRRTEDSDFRMNGNEALGSFSFSKGKHTGRFLDGKAPVTLAHLSIWVTVGRK